MITEVLATTVEGYLLLLGDLTAFSANLASYLIEEETLDSCNIHRAANV